MEYFQDFYWHFPVLCLYVYSISIDLESCAANNGKDLTPPGYLRLLCYADTIFNEIDMVFLLTTNIFYAKLT